MGLSWGWADLYAFTSRVRASTSPTSRTGGTGYVDVDEQSGSVRRAATTTSTWIDLTLATTASSVRGGRSHPAPDRASGLSFDTH